jgi:DNA-binding beta-propeller fold protein YncE
MKWFSVIGSFLVLTGCAGYYLGNHDEPLSGTIGESKYTVHPGWPNHPKDRVLGFVTAVELDSHGHVFTFHGFRKWETPFPDERESEPLILMWNGEDGSLINSWGEDTFRMPHGLSIDVEDNVWVTDVARNQVFKFSHEGTLLMVLGEDGIEGWDDSHFAKPTDVEFGPDGTVYVSDGYENCRIVKFTPDGQYLREWGECGEALGQFKLPHDLAVDRQGRVYVADRENDRIQVFDPEGEFIAGWHSEGKWRPYGLSVSSIKEEIYVADGGEQSSRVPDRSAVVVLDFSGNQVAKFGRHGYQAGQFVMAHDISVGKDGDVFVADVIGRTVQRFSESK